MSEDWEMLEPLHDFILIRADECKKIHRNISRICDFARKGNSVKISDDLLFCVADPLRWVPCYNPSTRENHYGLNYSGITLIKKEGAEIAAKIFNAWINLFCLGPEILSLRGMFVYDDEVNAPGDEAYERITIKRDIFLKILQSLAEMASQVVESNGEYYILHSGY